MSISGKGFFIWKIQKCENGDVHKIAQLAYQSGFSHVIIKVANGIWKYNYDWENHIDWCHDLVDALRDNGIEPWGWHYVFGEDPVREARVAIERVKGLDLKGYVIDAEAHYKREKHRHEAAERFMGELRKGVGKNVPLALSSYRFPIHASRNPLESIPPRVRYQYATGLLDSLAQSRCPTQPELCANLPVPNSRLIPPSYLPERHSVSTDGQSPHPKSKNF